MIKAALGTLLDALYPPVCIACGAETGRTGGLCAICFAEAPFITGSVCTACGLPSETVHGPICDGCRHAPPGWDEGRAAALYDGPVRRAVLAFKHGDRLDIARAVAPWLLRAGHDLLAGADLVVPVPLHWRRLVQRRFNQSAELARALCALAGRREAYAPGLVARMRATPSQEGRSRAARLANMDRAFEATAAGRAALPARHVLMIDDVMTTGATLSALAEALRAAGAARVDALALARVTRADDATM